MALIRNLHRQPDQKEHHHLELGAIQHDFHQGLGNIPDTAWEDYNGVGSGERDAYGPGGTFGDAACSENSDAAGYQPGYIDELKMNGSGGFISPGAPGTSYFSNRVANSLNGMDGGPNSSRTKRGVLPKRATQVMKQWLFQHLVELCLVAYRLPHPSSSPI
ncbi:hypothetical protein ACTXT7_008965 [Hymenolepis weldensis]